MCWEAVSYTHLVLGPGTVIGDGEIVSAKTLLDRHHGEVKA